MGIGRHCNKVRERERRGQTERGEARLREEKQRGEGLKII